jgi:hypothetical protein
MSDTHTAETQPRLTPRPHVLLRTGPALALLILVSLGYNWYYLEGGFQADDYFFLNMLRQDPRPYSRWLGLWAVDDVPALTNVWWFEGGDVGVFWRPLPSLLFEGSIRAFGEHAFPLHLLSVIVHGLVGGTLFLLVRRLTGRPLAGFLAGLLFLSCEDHSMGVGWISTVTDLVCVLFVNLALLAHTLWLEKRRPWALAAALLALVPALLSKESAVVAPLAIVLMTLVMPGGRAVELPAMSVRSLRAAGADFLRDWLSWAPAIALLVGYLALYKLLGFGGINSGMYIDPFGHPGRYAAHLVVHLPVMWLATLSPVLPSLAMFLPELTPVLAVAGAVAFAVWVAGLWSLRKSALVIWAMIVYILALLPQMSTDASERCLYFPAIASSILLALLLMQIGPIARRLKPQAPRAPLLTRIVGWAVLPCVLLPGAVLSASMPFMYVPSFETPNRDAASIAPHVQEKAPDHVLLLNTPGIFHTFYLPPIVEYDADRPLDVRVLSSMNGVVSVERLDDRSFILRADRPGWLTNIFAAMLRSPRPPQRGKVYEGGILTATLLEMTPGGRDVLAVRFQMNRPLDDPSLLFMQWDGKRFRPIDLAALPTGESVTLADTSDVWGSMW